MDTSGWNENQLKYARFLGRGKRDLQGNKQSKEVFASIIGVNPTTLYDWQSSKGFWELVNWYSWSEIGDKVAALNIGVVGKAMGQKEFKNVDVQAYRMVMQQLELLKSEKQEIKTEIHNVDTALD